jgi:hypothetical protein
MPTPPLRKMRSASPRRASSAQRTVTPITVARPALKSATDLRHAADARRAAEDFAFTQDPLSGSVTLHAGRDGTQHILEDRPAGEVSPVSRLGICSTDAASQGSKTSKGAPETWSDLEPDPTPIAQSQAGPLIAPVPNPDALH